MITVREIETPPGLEALAGLKPVDYRESFTFTTSVDRPAEQWARQTLERCPRGTRAQMIAVWTLLGIPLAPPWSRAQVLGWRILHNSSSHIVLESRAATGVTARLVLHSTGTDVTQAMLVRFDRPLGRRIWTRLAPKHRRFLRALLARAAASPPPASPPPAFPPSASPPSASPPHA
ncbi:hypothetical protein [Paractinoplanes hotanensis]|uniref:DUF2867 domain-containing protein n=1 Tax=Paractinoplanes hotanensis TaxID=2906497 RepID=A0ABT0YEE1_9ACTN|nr:hypothetical protein [Actinoplanes hotanensis]MCM4084418.1 hypothetical protein [Actinoplanes hotanensis]